MKIDNPIILRSDAKRQLLLQYFTGKPCKYGHLSPRLTSDGTCLECCKLRSKSFRESNPEYASTRYHATKHLNPSYNRDYYQRNKQKAKDYNVRYYSIPEIRAAHLEICTSWRRRTIHRVRNTQRELFSQLSDGYILPTHPTERDLKYWIAGQISRITGATVLKEQYIDSQRTSRIDLLIPELRLAVECKLCSSRWTVKHVTEQLNKYETILTPRNYTVTLVSVDGSLGISAEQFVTDLLQAFRDEVAIDHIVHNGHRRWLD